MELTEGVYNSRQKQDRRCPFKFVVYVCSRVVLLGNYHHMYMDHSPQPDQSLPDHLMYATCGIFGSVYSDSDHFYTDSVSVASPAQILCSRGSPQCKWDILELMEAHESNKHLESPMSVGRDEENHFKQILLNMICFNMFLHIFFPSLTESISFGSTSSVSPPSGVDVWPRNGFPRSLIISSGMCGRRRVP